MSAPDAKLNLYVSNHRPNTNIRSNGTPKVMSTRPASTAGSAPMPAPAVVPLKTDSATVYVNDGERKDAKVKLHYLKNDPLYDTVKPLQVTPPYKDVEHRTNVRLTAGPEEILNDVRGREDNYTLDGNGFHYVHAPTNFKDWSSQPQIAKEYLPEMEELLKREVEGCDEIIFYDARIRQEGEEGARVQGLSFNPFARQVHVDNTETSVREKIRNITDMKADYHLSGRAQIINIWRPIKHPVYDCGLAIADGSTLQEGDVMECDRYRQDTGRYWDTMGVIKYRPGFDWYYMSLQDEANVLLFKNYDSAKDIPARWCLHTAFDLAPEEVPADAPTRESIEVRALVFTHPKGVRKPSSGPTRHPLAVSLEQSDLKLVDDERSITDRLRTDIDEGNEIKDAMLLLRRHEIRRLDGVREALQHELEQAQQQISIQTAHSEALQNKISTLEQQLQHQHGDLRAQIRGLSRELADARIQEQTRVRTESDGLDYAQKSETDLLLEHIVRQDVEIAKWKQEAMGRGNDAVSRSWQASVDEAVRKEREKDSFVVKGLRDEIERLRAGQSASESV